MTTPQPPIIRSRPWLIAAIALVGAIFATLEVAPKLWEWLQPMAADHMPELAVMLAGCVCAALVARAWTNGPAEHRARRVLLLMLVFAGAGLALASVLAGTTMAAKVHLVQYGALTWWALNAVRFERRPVAAAIGIVLAIGALDEGVQHLLPSRYFDVRDILANWWATGLGTLAWFAASRVSPLSHERKGTTWPESSAQQ